MIVHIMKNRGSTLALMIAFLASLASVAAGADPSGAGADPSGTGADQWPQWRGPHFNGSSDAKNLPDRLDSSTLRWSVELPGIGANTPIVYGDRVFVSCLDEESKKLFAVCLSKRDGRTLWSQEIGLGFRQNDRNNMATPSAVTDGKLVFFYYGTGDLVAFDMDGQKKWARNIQKDFGEFHINWLYGSSPLLYDNRLYIQVLHRDVPARGPADGSPKDSYLLAINPETGKDLWRHIRPNNAREESKESYATPIPYTHDGRTEILMIGGDVVSANDAATGQELWRCGGWNPRRAGTWRVVTSVVPGDGMVFVCPLRTIPMFAIRDGGSGDVTDSGVVWRNPELYSDVCVPLLYRDRLYVLAGDQKKISCADPKTGKVLWSGSLGGRSVFRSSPTGADGKIYCMNENGDLWVLSADRFQVLSRSSYHGERCRAAVVVIDGEVLVRSGQKLYAFTVKPSAA